MQSLAAALERERREIKNSLLQKDEAALFELANGFGIRHNDRKQRVDYDDDVWLDWTFHVYLATAHAIAKVRARKTAGG